MKYSIIKLTFIQKLKLRIFGHVSTGERRQPGWNNPLPFYVFECSKHGLVENYASGYKKIIKCPFCMDEQTEDEQ